MEVILVKPVKKLGIIGDLVKVKAGYGRNFLLPQNLAIRSTPENIKLLEKQKQEMKKMDVESQKKKSLIAKKIQDKEIIFIMQSSEDGKLFGSVTKKLIAEKISSIFNETIARNEVLLANPIKNISIQEISLELHPEISCNVKVVVGRTEEETADLISGKSKFCNIDQADQMQEEQKDDAASDDIKKDNKNSK